LRFYDEAETRGDRYVTHSLQLGAPFLRWLAKDDILGAERALARASRGQDPPGLELGLLFRMQARGELLLYRGAARDALALAEEITMRLRESKLFGAGHAKAAVASLKGRAALAVAANVSPSDRGDILAVAAEAVGDLLDVPTAGASARAELLWAAVAQARGERDVCLRHLVSCRKQASTGQFTLLEAIADLAVARVRGQPETLALQRMIELGVTAPHRLAATLAPGIFEAVPGPT
jgi:hypothetical protein